MIPATFKKVFADLGNNKARSVLVVLSIAVGVFAVGVIASSFAIVKKDMATDYEAVNPHTARIYTADFDSNLLATLGDIPGVEAIEARYNLWVKITGSDGKEYEINLDSISPLETIQVDQLQFEQGSSNLGNGEIYLERQGAAGLGVKIGDQVNLTLNDGELRTLLVVGTVHDVVANPFKFTSKTSGYVTPATMSELGGSSLNNYVTLVTTGSLTDAVHIRQIADRVAEKMTASGITVYNINIPNPGQHPAQSIIDTVLMLMGVLSVLVIFLSAFLVTNTVSALMGQQVRQIGVMKAVGATIGQVVSIYLGLALAFGLLALLVAVPLAALTSYGLTRWLIGMLNATPSAFAIPTSSLVIQFFIGLAVPVFGALIPVVGGARRTVRQAMTSYGLEGSLKSGVFDRILDALPWLSRPLMLSLRNTFRRKARLVLTLVTLILGGAIFIAMFGVRESLYLEIDRTHGYYQSDVNADFTQPYPLEQLQTTLDGVPGVASVEGWSTFKANVLHADGETSDQIVLFAPPADTHLVNPVMTEGRWLLATDTNTIVVSNHFVDLRPDVKLGDTILLRLNEQDTPFQVVGFFRMAGTFPSPYTYVPQTTLNEITGTTGQVNSLKIVTDRHDPARQDEVLDLVKARFSESGLEASLATGGEIINQQRSQIDILITLLLATGLLIATVGGLGLMGTMGMNVLERTREIGVLRSIGAENGAIFRMVVVEGALIGVISWALSALVAIPITQFLDNALGERLMTVPIVYVFSYQGLWVWLVVALVLAALASLLPARNAVRLTVRDVLAYE
jgi:putative ABC transport system permease protein